MLKVTRQGKIIILMIIAIASISTIVLADDINLFIIETKTQVYYNNWDKPEYDGWNCDECSVECEKYFEDELGYGCYLVYGHKYETNNTRINHMWNIAVINGKLYEFESTCLSFQKTSEDYTIDLIQEGFYVNGVKYNKSQLLDNWENLL